MTSKALFKALAASSMAFIVTGCGAGGEIDNTCDEVRTYQLAQEGRRLEVPEGLDDLDEFREMPLPEASPRPPRPKGRPCLDLPPAILGRGDSDDEEDDEG